jgi:hypothetical protein
VAQILRYKPVALTPQLTVKLMLLLVGKLGKIKPPPVSKLGQLPATGQVAAGLPPVAEQAVTLQLARPALGTSRATEPPAELGPALAKVMV